MPSLTRRKAAPLLRTVNGKPHATQDHHADLPPTPPTTNSTRSSRSAAITMEDEEDINRSPISSEDERPAQSINVPQFIPSRQTDGAVDDARPVKTFQKLPVSPPNGAGNRKSQFLEPRSGDSDSIVFEENNFKRRKIDGLANFHAPPRKLKEYGKRQRHSWQETWRSAGAKASVQSVKSHENTPARAEFKLARGRDILESGQKAAEPEFRVARGAGDIRDHDSATATSPAISTSSLSSAKSSPEAEEKQKSGPPAPTPLETECAICGERVDVLVKEEFENTFTNGKSILNYKWQQRFCRWHSQKDARRKQLETGYPDIDWGRLERRMQRHHTHLKDVMAGSKGSYYRDQLSERVKERSKTTIQVLNDGARRGASVGYYGPRGERVMTEHIINHLSDRLREQSSKDRLVAAAGVSGGVSGFVQAVLVPELAAQLVMEDMKVSSERSREIIVQSAELGELLHPDVDDNVAEVMEL